MIRELRERGDPLSVDFERANERAESGLRVARTVGDYPWLSRGDVNLYSLFVERAMGLVGPAGVVGLLTPSGIASDKTAAPFFRSIATEGRLRALYDFENRRTRYDLPLFFPDVDSRFKFCAFIAGRSPAAEPARCAFFLQSVEELQDSDHCFPLMPEDFATVNLNTGTAPIFRTWRDAKLTTAIYRRLPVLVDRSTGDEVKTWPVKYTTMFHMTNDSSLERIGAPHVRHLTGPLWEMRLTGRDGIARALYIAARSRRVVVVRVFMKKTRRTPRRESELALRRAGEVRQ